ncbi:MAG TPA: hypothetical protein PLK94_03040 [Alphaproteobacteria bacterium]|nr:hypothetical protein [Alphaproteobacteria bacterium]MCB9985037.1 hypothetical protein [Micavibrio sp.]HOO50245.1 hypothetical protein [Alphaproteobacteria bacterium]
MKSLKLATFLIALSCPAFAEDTYVNGYVRQDGTYVQPHFRSQSDNYLDNNFSTRGNINPYTGDHGTENTPSLGYPKGGGENNFNYQQSPPHNGNYRSYGSSYQKPPSGM